MYLSLSIYIYIYIYTHTYDDTVGNPRRAQICQFELFELVLLLKFDKQFPAEQFEATVSQSTVPSPLYIYIYINIYVKYMRVYYADII